MTSNVLSTDCLPNRLDPGQVRQNWTKRLDPNRLQRLKADASLAGKGLNDVLRERQVIWNRYLSHDMTNDMRNLPYIAYINNKGVSHMTKVGHFLQEWATIVK